MATSRTAGADVISHGDRRANLVIVHKADRVLQLKSDDSVLHTFQIALGWAPEGHKRREGDGRTPEGVYALDWRNSESQFYRSIHLSYPEARDLESAARWGVPAGGMIMIHGLPNRAVLRRAFKVQLLRKFHAISVEPPAAGGSKNDAYVRL